MQSGFWILDSEAHPYYLLKTLKKRLAPTDRAIEASKANIAEVQEDRLITEFLLAIHAKDPRDNHATPPTPTCICGKKHWYSDCYYLNSKKRPTGWTEVVKIRRKVNEALGDPTVNEKVKKSIAKRLAIDARTASMASTISTPSTPSQASFKTHASQSTSDLCSMLILSSGYNTHVCNASMRHLYTKNRESNPQDRIKAGENEVLIESYGSLLIKVDTPNGPETITLVNVAYVPKFLTNIAALNHFAAKRVHFDSAIPHMHTNGETKFKIYQYEGYYTFMNPQHRQAAAAIH